MKSKIKLILVERKGNIDARGHKVGDTFDIDTERGLLCLMAMYVTFPYVDILRYGGTIPAASNGEIRFCCPDSDVINVFKIEKEDLNDTSNN